MSRLLYISLVSIITIAGFTMYKQHDIGHITFSFGGFFFETNLVVFTGALLCCLFLILFIIQSYEFVKSSLRNLVTARQYRLSEKAQQSLNKGLIEYAEGRFEQAEKILLQQIKFSNNGLLAYLSAARAAQQLGAHERRDEYLQRAQLESPDANLAIGLTMAELQLAHKQNEQALATLAQLNVIHPNHAYVLTLLANTYKYLQDWDNLKSLLPQLKKHTNLSAASFLSFEITVCNGQLTALAKSATLNNLDAQPLIDFWINTSPHLKTIPDIVEHYAKHLIKIEASGEAESVLRNYLNKSWQESTVVLYSELDVAVDNKQLEIAETWLKTHSHNAYLLLALGKMCISRALWGKAKNYLEASIAINPMPESYLKLARLQEDNMNDLVAAQRNYRHGLLLLANDCDDLSLRKNGALLLGVDTPQLKIVKS